MRLTVRSHLTFAASASECPTAMPASQIHRRREEGGGQFPTGRHVISIPFLIEAKAHNYRDRQKGVAVR